MRVRAAVIAGALALSLLAATSPAEATPGAAGHLSITKAKAAKLAKARVNT